MRFREIQICARSGLPFDRQRAVNVAALTSVQEILTLWLRSQDERAPFRKFVVAFTDQRAAGTFAGHVANVLSVCVVDEAVDLSTLEARTEDNRWVCGMVLVALGRASERLGWRSEPFERFVAEVAEREWPLVHLFEKLERVERSSKQRFVPFLSTRPGQNRYGVRISAEGGGSRDVVVVSKSDPIWDEDFPMAKSALRDGQFLLLAKDGTTLANVAVEAGGAPE